MFGNLIGKITNKQVAFNIFIQNENIDNLKATNVNYSFGINGDPTNPVTGGDERTYNVVVCELNRCITNINNYRALKYTAEKSLKTAETKEDKENYEAMVNHYSEKLEELEKEYQKLSAELQTKNPIGAKFQPQKYESQADFDKRMKNIENSSSDGNVGNKDEDFNNVYNEMSKWVEDLGHGNGSTQTIEEKQKAIEYIDRMLACSNIPDDAKEFWTKQREVILQEIENIKNSKNENFQTIYNEMSKWVEDLGHGNGSTQTIEEKQKAIKYIDRMLACSDIPDNAKEFWTKQREVILQEIENIKNSKNVENEDNDAIPTNYNEAVRKYQNFTINPNRTLEQGIQDNIKAIRIIDNILACNDIPNEDKAKWNNEKQLHVEELARFKAELAVQRLENSDSGKKAEQIKKLEKEKEILEKQLHKLGDDYKKEKKYLLIKYNNTTDLNEKNKIQVQIENLGNKYDKMQSKIDIRITVIDNIIEKLKS